MRRKPVASESEYPIGTLSCGLTDEDVRKRTEAGLLNTFSPKKTQTVPELLFDHFFITFHVLQLVAATALWIVGSRGDLFYFLISAIGLSASLIYEIRTKRTLDGLDTAKPCGVRVLRNGKELRLTAKEIVFGDVLLLSPGDVVPCGSRVLQGKCAVSGYKMNEKDELTVFRQSSVIPAGALIVSGKCIAAVVRIGSRNVNRSVFYDPNSAWKDSSGLFTVIRRIAKAVALLSVLFAVGFYWLQYEKTGSIFASVRGTSAALIGILPEGLALVFFYTTSHAARRMAKKGILSKNPFSLEGLAKADVFCFTQDALLSEKKYDVSEIVSCGAEPEAVADALSFVASRFPDDLVSDAVLRYTGAKSDTPAVRLHPFFREKPCYTVYSAEGIAYILGEPDYVLTAPEKERYGTAEALAGNNRVLCLSAASGSDPSVRLPGNRKALGFVLFSDALLENALSVIRETQRKGVTVKLFSGDSADATARIAREAGIPGSGSVLDLGEFPEGADLAACTERYSVFCGVTPIRMQLLVRAMKENEHTVVLCGSGASDVPALLEADCAAASNQASDAAREAADIVLPDRDFSTLSEAVAEARGAINNAERFTCLYFTEILFFIFCCALYAFLPCSFFLTPSHVTVIRLASLLLTPFALRSRPSAETPSAHFLPGILRDAFPVAVALLSAVLSDYLFGKVFSLGQSDVSSASAVSVLSVLFFCLFFRFRPLDRRKLLILFSLLFVYLNWGLNFPESFDLRITTAMTFLAVGISFAVAGVVFLLTRILLNGFRHLPLEKYVMRLFSIIGYFVRKMKAHHVDAFSAQIAFFVLFSVMPLCILVVTLISFLPITTEEFVSFFEGILPSAPGDLFRDIIDGVFERSSVMASFSAVAVIWSASKSVYCITGGLNSVFEVKETRNAIKVRALSIFYILVFVILMAATLFLMVFSSSFTHTLSDKFPRFSQLIENISSLRFAWGLLLLTLMFCLIYKALPNRKTRFLMQLPGAMVAAVGWVLFSSLFSYYADNIANYAKIYGSLSTIVVFMFWLYFCIFIMFFGAELNLLIERVGAKNE